MSTYRLNNLLAPQSVALVGASPRPGSVGKAILNNIRAAQFKGQVGVVNPRYSDIAGMATVSSLAKLPFAPELVIITVPAETIPGIIVDAASRGTAGAVIISAGLGHGAGSLAEAANRAARDHGMRLIGSNCLGILMPGANLNASFAAQMPRVGNLALISQSGAIAAGMVAPPRNGCLSDVSRCIEVCDERSDRDCPRERCRDDRDRGRRYQSQKAF